MLVFLATELIRNLHLNTIYGSEENKRAMGVLSPYHQVFLSSGFREVDAALGTKVVCNYYIANPHVGTQICTFFFFCKKENLGAVSLPVLCSPWFCRLEMRKWTRR